MLTKRWPQEDFNNLSSPFPHLLVSGPVNTVVAGMEVTHELSNTAFHQPRPMETYTESPIWHHALRWIATYLVQVHSIGPLPSWKEQHFVLTRTDTYSGHRFAFFAHNSLPKLICGLICCNGIWHRHHFWSRNLIGLCSWNSLVSRCSRHSEVAGLLEWWDGL